MKKIPCKRDKCLKYPICVSEASITCTPLRGYFHYILLEYDVRKAWSELNKHFPNLRGLGSTI